MVKLWDKKRIAMPGIWGLDGTPRLSCFHKGLPLSSVLLGDIGSYFLQQLSPVLAILIPSS